VTKSFFTFFGGSPFPPPSRPPPINATDKTLYSILTPRFRWFVSAGPFCRRRRQVFATGRSWWRPAPSFASAPTPSWTGPTAATSVFPRKWRSTQKPAAASPVQPLSSKKSPDNDEFYSVSLKLVAHALFIVRAQQTIASNRISAGSAQPWTTLGSVAQGEGEGTGFRSLPKR